MAIEFISYDGEYPNLCRGTLKVLIDGKPYSFGDGEGDLPHFWCTGGRVSFSIDWGDASVEKGEWESNGIQPSEYPTEVAAVLDGLLDIMNANVRNGCCGGCI